MTISRCYAFPNYLPFAAVAFACVLPAAAHAQKPTPSAKPSAAPAPAKQVMLSPTRPGTYSFWTVGKSGGQSAIGSIAAGQKTAPISLPADASEIHVLDEATGTVAVYPTAKIAGGATVAVAPADFTFVKSVQVAVTANGGKPVEKASVSLTDAKGKTVSRVLTAADNGVARFDDVPVGKASVSASYGDAASGGPKVTQEGTIAPPKGGGAVEMSLALSGANVPTLAPTTPASGTGGGVSNAPGGNAQGFPAVDNRDANSGAGNNWIPGVVGIIAMAGGIVYGVRYAKNKGVTVPGVLKQMGVEMPQDAPGSTGPLKPAAPVLPPLPSLGDLPSAGAAPVAVAAPLGGFAASGAAAPASSAVLANPRLVGLVGPVGGETFLLDTTGPLSVGRDEGNTLALTQDTTLSRKHARIEAAPSGSGWAVTDAGSSNGTFVNGQKVAGSQLLRVGDEIQIGASRFRFEA